jgi:hypothetical protein
MKVKNLIKQLEQYNQEADVFVNSNFKDIGFTIAYGGEGVEKENCETVSIYPDNLGAENTNNCASMIYNPKEWEATLGVDSSRINFGYESMQVKMYSEEEVIELLQKALTHKDDGEIGSLVTAQGQIRTANFHSWFNKFKNK